MDLPSFKATDRWQSWLDYAHEKGPVDPDPTTCSVSVWSRSLGEISISEAVDAMLVSGVGEDHIRTAIWIFSHALQEFPQGLIDDLCRVVALDPPMAAYVYQDKTADLTQSQKRILWDAFAETMPVARQKLTALVGAPDHG